MKIVGACVPILAASLAVAGTNDYPTEARAAERAKDFARSHSPDAYVDVLLAHEKA